MSINAKQGLQGNISTKNELKGSIVLGRPLTVVELSDIEGGHKITVTDTHGVQELEVMDGADGYTPVKGVDYFDGEKGDKGDDGYTPVKGVDYFDGEKGDDGYTPVKGVDYFDGKNGYTPVKGVDYFDGEKGEKGDKGDDGYTPVKGVDYYTDAETEELKQEIINEMPDVVPIKNGGTDATTAEQALDNLGGIDKNKIVDLTSVIAYTSTATLTKVATINIPANCIASITAHPSWGYGQPLAILLKTTSGKQLAATINDGKVNGTVNAELALPTASVNIMTTQVTSIDVYTQHSSVSSGTNSLYVEGFYSQL